MHTKETQNKNRAYLILSAALSISLLIILGNEISISELKEIIGNIYKPALILFFISSLVTSVFRTILYDLICRANGYSPPSTQLFLVVLARNAISDLLPAKIGSTIYIYLLKVRLKAPIDIAISSFAIPFIFDWVALGPMILIAAVMVGLENQSGLSFAVVGGLLFIGSTAVAINLDRLFKLSSRTVDRIKIGLPLLSPLSTSLNNTADRITALKNKGILLKVFALSLIVRLGKYITLYILLFSLLTPLGYSIETMPFHKVFLGICAAETSATLPISGIGGFGVYQGVWSYTFQLLGFPEKLALLTGFAHHILTQVWGYSLGIAALALLAIWKNSSHSSLEEK